MKKVSEIAKELEVSKQSIYYWINKLGKDIQEHIYKDGNAKVIDEPGVDMIRKKIEGKKEIERPFNVNNQYPAVRPQDKEIQALKDRIKDLKEYNKTLKEQIEILKYQLESKDQQINNLHRSLDKSQDRIEALTGKVEKKSFMEKVKNIFN